VVTLGDEPGSNEATASAAGVLAAAVGRDRKGKISILLYVIAISVASRPKTRLIEIRWALY
jgi:hypothetical protein